MSSNATAAAAVHAEMDNAKLRTAIAPALARIRDEVAAATETRGAEARAKILSGPAFTRARTLGQSYITQQEQAEEERRKAERDPTLSAVGKGQAFNRLAEQADVRKQNAVVTAAAIVADIRASRPGLGFRVQPPPAVMNDATLFWLRYPQINRGRVLTETADTVLLARASTTDAATALRANMLLKECYGPACERTALSPEGFAVPYSALAADLAEAIRAHLDELFDVAGADAISQVADELEADFNTLINASTRYTPDLYPLAMPTLFGSEQS